MKITWFGHACFGIDSEEYKIVIDPYGPGTVPGYSNLNLKANMAVATHKHGDHNDFSRVKISKYNKDCPFIITKMATYHDDEAGALRGENMVHIFEAEGMKAVHLGDLGHKLSDGQMKIIWKPDILMIPVGGYFTIDGKVAAETVKRLGARVVIPMHYRNGPLGYEAISDIEPFLSCFEEQKIKRYDVDTIEVDKSTPAQIAVLKYRG